MAFFQYVLIATLAYVHRSYKHRTKIFNSLSWAAVALNRKVFLDRSRNRINNC